MMIAKFKERVGVFFLSRIKSERGDRRKMCNLESADKVLVLCSVNSQEDIYDVIGIIDELRNDAGIEIVDSAVFFNMKEKKVKERFKLTGYKGSVITKDQLNWYGKPGVVLEQVLNNEYDILLDVSITEELPVKFAAAACKAHTKAGGCFNNRFDELFDFTVKLKNITSVHFLSQQLKKYLMVLNKV